MLGFVKTDKEKRPLGGDIFRQRQRNMRITYTILGLIGFTILNVILYLLTKV